MPVNTPNQKVSQVKKIGKDNIKVVLIVYKEPSLLAAISFCHPYSNLCSSV